MERYCPALLFCLLAMVSVSQGFLSPVSSKECKDYDENCSNYGYAVCAAYSAWSKRHCEKYCNLCDTPPIPNKPCLYKNYKMYAHGEKFVDGCARCTCENGFTPCMNTPCIRFTLPSPKCEWVNKPWECCPVPSCPKGIKIVYPDWIEHGN